MSKASNKISHSGQPGPTVYTRIKILAYLGQLLHGEWAAATTMCTHLHLRYPTTKKMLKQLEDAGIVHKKIVVDRLVEAYFQLNESHVPPDWDDSYGTHPRSV